MRCGPTGAGNGPIWPRGAPSRSHDMKVTLTNDGPVTFWLRCAPRDS